jgi:hypothetical protein
VDVDKPKPAGFLPHSFNPGEKTELKSGGTGGGSTPKPSESPASYKDDYSEDQRDMDEMLYARHAEIKSLDDLATQRGTNIPALYNQVYRFIQNPSTVSVETFKRMVDTDETVGSGVDFLTTCLAARLGLYTHPSEEVAKFVNKALNEIQGGWTNAVKEMLSASWAGFSVGEKVWANTNDGFVPKKIVQLPPGTLLFETDRTGELTIDGILQYQRNYNPALFGSGTNYLFGFSTATTSGSPNWRPDLYAKMGDYPFPLRTPNMFSYMSVRIPVRKCIHYSFDCSGKFGNPYGRSLLRRAYKHWVLKDTVLQMMAVALDRKGTPLQVWYVDPAATFIDSDKYVAGKDLQNMNIGIRAQDAVKKALSRVHNDSVIIMPGKKGQFVEHDFINQQSNAQDFIAALNYLDTRIMRALLLPPLVFSSGDGAGSYALGQEHAKTFDKILDGFLAGLKQTLMPFIKEIIAYNFPREAWEEHGLGEFADREMSVDEREKEMTCVQTAVTMGAIDINDLDDLNKVRDIAGFKARTEPIPQPDLLGIDGETGDEEDGGDGPTPKQPGTPNGGGGARRPPGAK